MGSYKWQVHRIAYLFYFIWLYFNLQREEKPLNWDKDVIGLTDKVLYIDLNAA